MGMVKPARQPGPKPLSIEPKPLSPGPKSRATALQPRAKPRATAPTLSPPGQSGRVASLRPMGANSRTLPIGQGKQKNPGQGVRLARVARCLAAVPCRLLFARVSMGSGHPAREMAIQGLWGPYGYPIKIFFKNGIAYPVKFDNSFNVILGF